jgi:hypothetical protein
VSYLRRGTPVALGSVPIRAAEPVATLRSRGVRRVVLLVVSGLALGAVLTGLAGALPGSQDLNALTWLASVSTVAALVVAVGIYHVQQGQSDAAHQELLDALKAQDEILQDLADATPPAEAPAPASAEPPQDGLTEAQRAAVRDRFGERAIDAAWTLAAARRGRGNRARLVRLADGALVSVFTDGRSGRMRVHEIKPGRGGGRFPRERRAREPEA